MADKKPLLLIVDDEEAICDLFSDYGEAAGFECLKVHSVNEALKIVKTRSVDFIFLDMLMPERLGPELLIELNRLNLQIPTFIITGALSDKASSLLALLPRGVYEIFGKVSVCLNIDDLLDRAKLFLKQKRSSPGAHHSSELSELPRTTIRTPSTSQAQPKEKEFFRPDALLIGGSTGAIEVIEKILAQFDLRSPPVLCVQHISVNFLQAIADRISKKSGLKLSAFKRGLKLEAGTLYMPLEELHMGVVESNNSLYLETNSGPPIHSFKPSVDYLFHSFSKTKKRAYAALLTGMGRDGASGLKALYDQGSLCLTQNEESCVVYGMPMEAKKLGASHFSLNPDDIRKLFLKSLE